jgi:hypothetical protein
MVNSSKFESCPSISADGLELYFDSDRPGGYGGADIYVTQRSTRTSPWGPATNNLGPKVNTSYHDFAPSVSSDGLELYFNSSRPGGLGGLDIFVSKRATRQDPWGDPVNLGPIVNSTVHDRVPRLSSDGLLLLFQCDRPGGFGDLDLWMTRRISHSAPWEPVVNLGPIINSSETDCQACLAPDGSALYFARDFSDRRDIPLKAPIIPIVDFNADGQVDGKEVLYAASCWGTDDSLCDIGPFAWGDGTVDLQDLIILADYIGKEVVDPTLIAYWALDEPNGVYAHESVGGKDDYILGDAAWEPSGGQVKGALQLDGIDDCVVSSFVLDPAQGPFSVLAWIQGGAPDQVIISQQGGFDWLVVDAEGKLMTELNSTGQSGPLLSQTIITDGQWHRIGLVWDGARRMLYVDGAVAAEDTQDGLPSSGNSLSIGSGNAMESGTFWSGLIDEMRIYSRVVSP